MPPSTHQGEIPGSELASHCLIVSENLMIFGAKYCDIYMEIYPKIRVRAWTRCQMVLLTTE